MITKFRIFEQLGFDDFVEPRPLYKVGDVIYYHGRLREHHGYYTVQKVYHVIHHDEPEKGDTGWRYDLTNGIENIRGSWEMSSSPNEEEGRRKDAEYHKRKEDQRILHAEFDPYGEEIWEHNEVDPYGEEDWDDKNKTSDIFDILLPDEDFDDREDRYFHRVGECRRCGRYAPNALMLDDVCPACRAEDNKCNMCGSYVPHEFLHDGICDACLKEPGWDF